MGNSNLCVFTFHNLLSHIALKNPKSVCLHRFQMLDSSWSLPSLFHINEITLENRDRRHLNTNIRCLWNKNTKAVVLLLKPILNDVLTWNWEVPLFITVCSADYNTEKSSLRLHHYILFTSDSIGMQWEQDHTVLHSNDSRFYKHA